MGMLKHPACQAVRRSKDNSVNENVSEKYNARK
jgi:hypothetical protein